MAFIGHILATVLAYVVLVSTSQAFPDSILAGKILPGASVALLWANISHFVRAIWKKDENVVALPTGVNAPGMYSFFFNITLVEIGADYSMENVVKAYHTTLAASCICGVLVCLAAPFSRFIRGNTPRVAFISSLSGLLIAYLALGNVATALTEPVAGFPSIFILIVGMLCLKEPGQVGVMPVTLIAMIWGSCACWMQGGCSLQGDGQDIGQTVQAVRDSLKFVQFYAISFPIAGLVTQLGNALKYISVILPISLQIFITTTTSVELAKAGGDEYNLTHVMITDGIGTIIGAMCGSTFQVVSYPNHAAYKRLGGKIGYTLVVPIVFFFMAMFGLFFPFLSIVPIQSIVPNIILIGLIVAADAMNDCESHHYIAFVVGTVPSIADWALSTSSHHHDTPPGLPYLAGGSLLIGLIWSAMIHQFTEAKFLRSAFWTTIAIICSLVGLIHASTVHLQFEANDMGWRFAIAYAQATLILLVLHILQRYNLCAHVLKPPNSLSKASQITDQLDDVYIAAT